MKSTLKLSLFLVLALVFLATEAEARINPQWMMNNFIQIGFHPTLLWVPLVSPLAPTCLIAYFYLIMMGVFGR